MHQALPINPTVLHWARLEAGLSLQDAAVRAKITPPRRRADEPELTAVERLAAWEEGRDTPSLNQLEKIASAYHRPLLTFFLPKPPEKIAAIADFRTVANTPSVNDSPEFSALRRRLVLIHQELCALARDAESPKLSFIGSFSNHTPILQFVANIRLTLGIRVEDQQRIRDEDALLGYLRSAAQRSGIYVLFEGNLGSYHSNISVEEFRGIAFSHDQVPMVIINPNDAKAAMVFTMVHELAHLWLGSSGISNFNALGNNGGDSDREKICNKIAAEFLVPETALRSIWKRPEGALNSTVDSVAKFFKVSGAVIGRRLLDMHLITSQEYGTLLSLYKARWSKRKEILSMREGAPGPDTLTKYRLGEKAIHTFISAARDGRIGLQDAARLMNVPVSRFDKVMQ